MQRIGKHIAVSFDDLIAAGVPERTARNGVSAGRRGWVRAESEQAVVYDELRPKYKAMLAEHYGCDPIDQLAMNEARAKGESRETQYQAIEQRLWELRESGYQVYIQQFHEAGHTDARVKEYAQAAAILDFGNAFVKGQHGIKSARVFKELIVEVLAEWKANNDSLTYLNVSNVKSLYRELKNARKKGLVEKVAGKSSGSRKYGQKYERMAQYYYIQGQKVTFDWVHARMQAECADKDWPCPSLTWVRQHLQKPAVRNLLMSQREGKKATQDSLMPYVHRAKAKAPNTIWQLDGTPLDIYYKKEDGRPGRQSMFSVIDMHSQRIIGFTLADAEDRETIMTALHMAVKVTGSLPKQILHDNASAFSTTELDDVRLKTNRLGCSWRAAKVGNSKDKSQVERFFKTFGSVAMRGWSNYGGQGIGTLEKDGKINPDKLAWNALPTLEQYRDQVWRMVEQYNSHRIREKLSPLEQYNATESGGMQINEWQMAELFWPVKEITASQGYIKFQHRHVYYMYYIPSTHVHLSHNGEKLRVRYDYTDFSEIHLFDLETDRYLCSCERDIGVDPLSPDRQRLADIEQRNAEIEHEQEQMLKAIAAFAQEEDIRLYNPAETGKSTLHALELDSSIGHIYRQMQETEPVDGRPTDDFNRRLHEERRPSIYDEDSPLYND